MPKEIQPLEGAPKLHYASVFPPKFSLLLLEINLVTLLRMYIDSLEVEDNIRMSKKNFDQESDEKMEN